MTHRDKSVGFAEVSFRRQSRRDLLAASITAHDPERTWVVRDFCGACRQLAPCFEPNASRTLVLRNRLRLATIVFHATLSHA